MRSFSAQIEFASIDEPLIHIDQCELEARQSRRIQSAQKSSSSKLRSNYPAEAQISLTTNKNIANVATQKVVKRIKTKLLARSMGNAAAFPIDLASNLVLMRFTTF